LAPTGGESNSARQHRASIEACLRSNFGLTSFFRTGSFGNGTSIRGFSDVDYFAVINRDYLSNNSAYSLQRLREVLLERFPYTTVSVKTPAVALYFGGGEETTEVVPADYLSNASSYGGCRIFDIPDANGGWGRASPEKHQGWINELDKQFSGKVKPLIRFAKAWKYYQNVPINSFYFELRIAQYASEQGRIVYSGDLMYFSKQLLTKGLAAIQDPMGVSGLVQPCATEPQRDDALSKLATAVTRAEKAWAAEESWDIKSAFDWWDMFFGGNFPSYY
jgi:hypothetical protein